MSISNIARRWGVAVACACLAVAGASRATAFGDDFPTTTPIKHLVVIFQENNSFDHYFGTYPVATNPSGEPSFTAADDTPPVNGLNSALINHNPNSVAPFRLDRSQQALDCDNSNAYAPSSSPMIMASPTNSRRTRAPQHRPRAATRPPAPPASAWAITTATP